VTFLMDMYDGSDIAEIVRKNPLSCTHDIISMKRVLAYRSIGLIDFAAFREIVDKETVLSRLRRQSGVF